MLGVPTLSTNKLMLLCLSSSMVGMVEKIWGKQPLLGGSKQEECSLFGGKSYVSCQKISKNLGTTVPSDAILVIAP